MVAAKRSLSKAGYTKCCGTCAIAGFVRSYLSTTFHELRNLRTGANKFGCVPIDLVAHRFYTTYSNNVNKIRFGVLNFHFLKPVFQANPHPA